MTTNDDDRTALLLTQALSEEAAQVDPRPGGLDDILRRTGQPGSAATRPSRRPWLLGAVGAGLATAAVITAVALVSHTNGHAPTPAADTSSGETGQHGPGTVQPAGALHKGAYDPSAAAASQVTMYYVGPQPQTPSAAPRLYPETHTVVPSGAPADIAAVHEFLTSTPIDPDYRSGWPQRVDVTNISTAHGVTTVALHGTADLGTRPLPVPFDPSRAVAVQGLLETAGIHGQARFTYNGQRLKLVLYTSASLRARPRASLRAPISIDNIVDGQTMTNPVTVLVSGNTFEGTVNWQLLDANGKRVDGGNVITAMGSWKQVAIDLGTLDPASYTFRALEYSAEDGSPINVDDKTFTVG